MWYFAGMVYLNVCDTWLRGWELCLCTGLDWKGAIFPFPPFFSWQDFCLSGKGTNSVTHPAGMQIFAAISLELPRPIFSRGTCSLAWPAVVHTSPASAFSPRCCQNHLQNRTIRSQCFPAQNPPVAPTGLVLFGGPGCLLRTSGVPWTLTPGGEKVHTASSLPPW